MESPEERKERLCRELNDKFKERMKECTNSVEVNKGFTATRTVVALYHGLAFALATPSEVQLEDLKEFHLLGEINKETLESLEKQKQRSDKFKSMLRAKEKYLEAEKIRKDQEISKKIGWVETKLAEVRAEEGALNKMLKFHEAVEDYVKQGFKELRRTQASEEAKEIDWNGLQFDLTQTGAEKLSSMTIYESMFSERLSSSETNIVTEIEGKMKEFEAVTTIDLEAEGQTSVSAAAASGAAMAPPAVPTMKKEPVETPKTKARPKSLQEKQEEEEKKRQEEALREKKKREADAVSEADTGYEGKRAKHGYTEKTGNLVKAKVVPKEYLYVNVTQDVWDLLGTNSRERLLSERETSDKCFFCGQEGHRAYACSRMLRLACVWGQLTGQSKFGGNDRKHSLWCSSCAYQNSVSAVTQNADLRQASGWFVHRDKCPLLPDEDLSKLSAAELKKHLKDVGVFGKEGEKIKEKEEKTTAVIRESEPRSVSVSEEPARKKLKKERKEEEKRMQAEAEAAKKAEEARLKKAKEETLRREEERLKKAAEEFKESLR